MTSAALAEPKLGNPRTVTRVVWIAAAAYAVILASVTWLRYEAFIPESDLGVFAQLTWLMGRLDNPFSTVALRPMLADHWEPGLALLAPLGTVGVGTVGLLVVQAATLGVIAPILLSLARLAGAHGWLAAIAPLLWLVSPIVVRANLWDFHPDVFIAALLILSVLALETRRTWLLIACVVLACTFKEDVGLTFAALGVAFMLNGHRRIGAAVSAFSVTMLVVLNFVLMPSLWPSTRAHYTERFVGDKGDGFGAAARYWVEHPVHTLQDALTTTDLGILAILVGMTGGLCLLAPRWLVVAVPTVTLNLLSAYEGQHTLKYQYWLVPGAAVAIAGAMGAGKVRARRVGAVRVSAVAIGAALLLLTAVSVASVIGDVRDEWPQRDDRQAIVDAVPAGASVSAPLRFLSHLADRRELFTFPVPFVVAAPESEWSPARIARARSTLEYVVFDPTLTDNPEVLPEVERLGFVPVLTRGTTVLYRSPAARR